MKRPQLWINDGVLIIIHPDGALEIWSENSDSWVKGMRESGQQWIDEASNVESFLFVCNL